MPITNIKIIAGVTGPFLETGFARSVLAASSTFLTNLESKGTAKLQIMRPINTIASRLKGRIRATILNQGL